MIQQAKWIAPEGEEKHKPCYFPAEAVSRSLRRCATALVEPVIRMIQLTFSNMSSAVILPSIRAVDRRYHFARKSSFFCGEFTAGNHTLEWAIQA